MTTEPEGMFLQLRSLITAGGELELSLASVEIPRPAPHEVLIRVQAAPINPSDLGMLFGFADMGAARFSGTAERPVVRAPVSAAAMAALAGRVGKSLPVGNEGAGLVVAAGASAEAQALLGKTVAACPGEMYGQFRALPADQALALADGSTPAQGASAFVNPLTALGMVETLRREGHTALVHTAAASSLGQMLNRLCLNDRIPLVNIVRKPEQEELLRAQGATHVCSSAAPTFGNDLTEAIFATGATLGFDATGGGRLASQILTAMEAALNRRAKSYSRYGSTTHKQVYLYGSLDMSPTELTRGYGMAWGIGGWLVFPYLQKIGAAAAQALKARVVAELTTTFVTSYTREVSLAEALTPEAIMAYGKRATNAKFLITP